jgi:hypothetical protein
LCRELAGGIIFALERTVARTAEFGLTLLPPFAAGVSSRGSTMALLAPPPAPPRVAVDDHDGLKRLRFRLWQILASAVTALVTIWLCTFGPIPAILALMVAKHVLVAILLMGLGVDGPRSGR